MFGAFAFGQPYCGRISGVTAVLAASAQIAIGVTPPNLSTQSRFAASATFTVRTQVALTAPVGLRATSGFALSTSVDLLAPSRYDVSRVTIKLGGVDVTKKVKVGSLTIHDAINHEVNTARLTFLGSPPQTPQPLEIYLNKLAPRLLFNGTLAHVDHLYYQKDRTQNLSWPADAVDDLARAGKRLPFGTWTNLSATTVAQQLVSTFAPGFTTTHVQAGLPPVSVVLNGTEGMGGALQQIAKLIGGYYYWENKDLHLFTEEGGELPDPIDVAHPFLNDPPITKSVDVTQIRTRVYGKGHGEALATDVLASETILPLADTTMFNATGGRAITDSQRLAYTGIHTGAGGGLIGPGASPSAAPNVGLAPGGGIETGVHQYALTYLTAAGESAVGPKASVTVGPVGPPGSGPNAASVSPGGSVDAGIHNYAASFVTATGETVVGIEGNGMTTGGAAAAPPASAPSAGAATSGGAVPVGTHYHAVTFVGASGETAVGPWSGGSTANATAGLGNGPTPAAFSAIGGGAELDGAAGQFWYVVTYVTGSGESLPSSPNGFTLTVVNPPTNCAATTMAAGSMAAGTYYYVITFFGAVGETTAGPYQSQTLDGTTQKGVQLFNIPTSGDARVTGRRIYRATSSSGPFGLLTTINDNSTTGYNDGAASVSGGAPPATNNTNKGRIQIGSVPTGPGSVTARKIYRNNSGFAPFFLTGTINNNTATTFIDSTASVTSNPSPPGSDTTGFANQTIPLSGIPTGPSGTTARKIYRSSSQSGGSLVATIANNSSTSYNDTAASGGAGAPSGSTLNTINVVAIPLGSPVVTARRLYRRMSGGVGLRLVTTINDNTTTTYTDTAANASLGAAPPSSGTATANQVSVSSIQIGGTGVTGRKLYRTAAGAAQLKLLATLDNVVTTYADAAADATLGPNAPVADTSGLLQPNGQIPAGATTIIVASTASFAATGGWAIIGNGQLVVRYTGLTGNSLTGVPATGPGSIAAAISYNSSITPAPALTGVTGLTLPLIKGVSVNIWVQRDDTAAQGELAALAGDGSDGIVEHLITDERRGEASLIALCNADLELYSRPIVTVRYATRDVKTKSGRPIVIDLAVPSIHETLTIQAVDIDQIDIAVGMNPRYTVTASTVRFSLEDVLRRLTGGLEGL
jgi:hypothetical protein